MLSKFIRPEVNTLRNEGFRVAVFNPRGSGVPQTTANIYDLADTIDDLSTVVNHIRGMYPQSNLYLLGNSQGASFGIQYIAKYNRDRHVKGMVSIGNPFDLNSVFKEVNSWKKWLYGSELTRGLISKAVFNTKSAELAASKLGIDFSMEDVKAAKSTFDFDDKFTFKFRSYATPEDYYDKLSCLNDVDKVNVPLLVIHSKNDPISMYFNKH